MPQGCDRGQVVALSMDPKCRHYITRSDQQIGNVSVMYVTLIPWWRERRHYVPMPQSWTIAECQGHVLGSSAENLRSGCTCHLFIPVCTGSGSGMQNPLANIHWHFLLKSEMIGAPTWTPKCRHDITSLFPPSENEGYICNRDVVFMENPTSMLWTIVIMISNVSGHSNEPFFSLNSIAIENSD